LLPEAGHIQPPAQPHTPQLSHRHSAIIGVALNEVTDRQIRLGATRLAEHTGKTQGVP
jgi:hypothetical protein